METYTVKKVLVPIDFSPLSLHALDYAERIAKHTRATLQLVHVVKPIGDAVGTSGMLSAANRWEEKEKRKCQRRLQKIAREVEGRAKIGVDITTAVGRIAQTIIGTIKETSADLVVMGTHGANGFLENLLGSTTYHISTLSQVPVLSVHKPAGKNLFRHLVYPVRGSSPAMAKLPYALTLARAFRSHVHILELLKEGESAQEAGIHDIATTIHNEFVGQGFETTRATAKGQLSTEVLVRYASQHAGAVVVIMREPDFALVDIFRGTFSKRVLHQMLSPVLTLPSRPRKQP